jgi:tight adherence protein B
MIGTVDRLRIETRPEFAKIVRVAEPYAAPDGYTFATRINGRFDRLIVQSGTQLAPGVALQLCILGAIACGGSVFVAQDNLLATAGAIVVGALLPITGLLIARALRQWQIGRQMPAMIGTLARAARTGRSLANGLELAAADSPSPLGDEIARSVRRIRMGVGVEAAIEDLPERTGVARMKVFVAALTAHDRTGCDLVSLLDRLTQTFAVGV